MKKIKSLATYQIQDGQEIQTAYEERNEDDFVTLRVGFNADGEAEQRDVFEYNEMKQLIKYTQYFNEEITQIIESIYNGKGSVELQKIQYADGKTSSVKFEDDVVENAETKLFYNENNELEGKEYRVFDKEGNVVEELIHDEDGAIESHNKIDFDEYHNPLKVYVRDNNGTEMTQFFFYDRDDKGYLDSVIVKDGQSNVLRREDYETDEKGNRTYHEINHYYEGWGRIYEMEYNENNKIIEYAAFDANEAPISKTTYEYDEDGNPLLEETTTKMGVFSKKMVYEFYG